MKKLIFLFTISLISTGVFAQLRLDENFDYTAGDSIGAHGWVWFSGVANTVFVTSPGLTYAGYPLSGIGNAASLTTNGNDQYKSLSSVLDTSNAQAVYASFMLNVTTAQRPGDYMLALLPSTSTSFFSGRVYARLVSGVLEFGLTKASQPDTNTMVWASGYSLGTTYLIVLKYKFNSGAANDEVSLFIFDTGLPSTEPAPTIGPMAFSTTSGDANNIGRVALRQGTSTRAPNCIVDGIRISKTWFSTSIDIKMGIQGLVLGNANINDTAEVYVRSSSSPYNIVESYYKAVSIVNGKVLMYDMVLPNSITADNYYLDVRYRHSVEFRNSVQTWSANPVSIAPYNGGIYDFTSSLSQAFGDNQVLASGTTISFYNGDVNQDNVIDGGDGSELDNDAANFEAGYLNTDLDGNDIVDGSDGAIVDNNAANFVSAVLP